MLRLIFVAGLVLAGLYYSLQGPFYLLLFYLWNAYFRPESWVWSDIVFSLRLSLLIGLGLVLAGLPKIGDIRLTRPLVIVLLFFVQATLSTFLSDYRTLILPFWIEFLKTILVSVLITVLVDNEKRLRLTIFVIAWSLGFETAKQGWGMFALHPGGANLNPHLMLGDNNGVALGMAMLAPLLLALAQTSPSRKERNVHWFVLAGVVYRGISTYSRGGFLSLGAVGVMNLLRTKKPVRSLLATSVLAVGIGMVMPDTFWDRVESIDAEEEDQDASVQSRFHTWNVATDVASDHPFLGVGMNAFRYAYDAYNPSRGAFGLQRAAHSSWFGILSDLGTTGFGLFVAVFVGAMYSCQVAKTRAKRAGLTELSRYAIHLQTSFIAFAVGGTFLSAQYLEFLWHLVAISIALERIVAVRVAAIASRPPAVAPVVSRHQPPPRPLAARF